MLLCSSTNFIGNALSCWAIYDETLVVYNTKPLRIGNRLILIEQVLNDLQNRLCFLDHCQNVMKLCNVYIGIFAIFAEI